MCASPAAERRQYPRQPLSARVHLHHQASRREFPARSVDVSEGGLLMYVPATTPVSVGQVVEVRFEDPPAGTPCGQTVAGQVARVDRQKLLAMGYLAVGVQFQQ